MRPNPIIAAAVRRPRLALALALVLTALGALGGLNLQIFTARKALFPKETPELVRLERFLRTFGAATDLIVALDGGDEATRAEFADALASRLVARPEIRSAAAGVDPGFFLDRLWLMLPLEAHEGLRGFLETAPRWQAPTERQLTGALDAARGATQLVRLTGLKAIGVSDDMVGQVAPAAVGGLEIWRRWLAAAETPTRLDLRPLLQPYGAGQLDQPAFTSRDGQLSFIFVRPSDISEEITALGPFVEATRAEVDALTSQWRADGRAPPEAALTGMPAVVYEEFTTLQSDIPKVAGIAGGLIALLILAWLRSVRRALAIFVPMGLGVVWSLGVVWLSVGHLTLLTSTFTAILFGLGVDYGIFMSARVLDELPSGADAEATRAAVLRGATSSVRPLLVAGGATALIFCALIPSQFTGFSELGVVAASGVFLVLLATVWVQPALLVLLPLRPKPERRAAKPKALEGPGPARALVVAGLLATAAGVYGALHVGFNHDLLSLLPPDSEAVEYQRRMTAESDFNAETVIFTSPSLEEARAIEEAARHTPALAQVQGPGALFPPDAEARARAAHLIGSVSEGLPERVEGLSLPITAEHLATLSDVMRSVAGALETRKNTGALVDTLRQVADLLKQPKALARTQAMLEAIQRRLVAEARRLDRWATAKPLTPEALPPALGDRLFAPDGTVAVYAAPRYSVYDPARLAELNQQIYAISAEATGFPTTHLVFSRMVVDDFVQGSLLALAIALAWIALVLRRLRPVVLAALPLVVGGAWMLGVMALFGLQFDFANVVALPLVMGLAVDYGVWLAHRVTDHPEEGAWGSARAAGEPILLAAATTLSGLGAVMSGQYAGMVGVGRSITIGLVACVVVALVMAPAVAALWRPR